MAASPKIYYAHPVSLYGTPQELRDLETLKSLGFDIVNPNTEENDERYQVEGMSMFQSMVQNCDAIAFRGFPCGKIPAGIAKEIEWAEAAGRMVIELPHMANRTLDVETTRMFLKELGAR